MSDNSNPTYPGSRLGRYKFVWLLLLPLLILLAVAAYWGISEWNAAQANRNQFEQWAAAGIPYDNATMEKSYNERTHPEGASDWIEIIKLIQWGDRVEAFKRLPYLGGESEIPTDLVPGGDSTNWPDEPLVASYLQEMEPVIDWIKRASSYPTPVRFPVEFQGIATLLPHIQEGRQIQRLLMLDCDFAYFHKDNQRVLRDLSLMKATEDAYDGRLCLVSELVNLALRKMRMGAMRRTLTHCQWSAAEFEILKDSLASKEEMSARWQDLMLRERGLGLSAIDETPETLAQLTGQGGKSKGRFKLYTGPREVKTLMEVYRRIIEVPIGFDISNWKKRAAAVEDWVQTLPSNSLAALLTPATATFLDAEIRAEDMRCWTLTAVAIQQFKKQNERWPKELAELKSVGLNFADYSNTEKEVFGYEVEGDKVFLWKQNPDDNATNRRISKTRPVPEKDKDASYYLLELN